MTVDAQSSYGITTNSRRAGQTHTLEKCSTTLQLQENNASPSSREWVVQKFGGTSIGKYATSIVKEVIGTGLETNRIAVVCSARSSSVKREGTTTLLLRAAREAVKAKGSRDHLAIVDTIQREHTCAAQETIRSSVILDQVIQDIQAECSSTIELLKASQHLEEISPRILDRITSTGEKLSCLFMTGLLKDGGINAHYIDVTDILRGTPTSITPHLDDLYYHNLAQVLAQVIQVCGDSVPVITGFFGNVPGGLLNTVGRGYTDLCAALVAVGIGANELQVWKDVDGIFTADPRRVQGARLLPSVTPSEAAELTFFGSEVLHPLSIAQAICARIPIHIRNVVNMCNHGTAILPGVSEKHNPRSLLHRSRLCNERKVSHVTAQHAAPKFPTAVTVKYGIAVLNVQSNRRTRAHGFLMNIFSTLDKWRLSVDLISSSEVHVSMALHSEWATQNCGGEIIDSREWIAQNEDLFGAVQELREFGMVDLVGNMAIVSLVGKHLKNLVGIAGRFLGRLGENGINVEMVSQGATEINISCVIDESQGDRALNILHEDLFMSN